MESDKIEKWNVISSVTEYRTRIFDIKKQSAKSVQGKQGDFYVIDTNDWVNVIALTKNEEVILVKQYRHGIDAMSLEIPGGVIDSGEESFDAAHRELAEETGYVSTKWIYLGKSSSNAAIMNNYTHTWLAQDCELTSSQELDEHEEIEIVLLKKTDFLNAVGDGTIHHSVVLAGVAKWLTHKI